MWAILREINPDCLVLGPRHHGDCWVCGEIANLGGKGLLNEEGHAPALQDVPNKRRRKSGKRKRADGTPMVADSKRKHADGTPIRSGRQ